MKLHAVLFTVLFGAIALGQTIAPPPAATEGQPKSAAKGSKPSADKEPPKEPKTPGEGSVFLAPEPLAEVIAEIERRIPTWPQKSEEGEWVMPNLLYSKEVGDTSVPGALTLRGVSPLQAVTLAAAAAGCKMEPIYAAQEMKDLVPQTIPMPQSMHHTAIIGYRIVLDTKQNAATGGPGIANGFFAAPAGVAQAAATQVDAANAAQSAVVQALNAARVKADDPARTDVTSLDSEGNFGYQKTGPRAMPENSDPFSNSSAKDQNGNRRPVRVVKAPDANLRSVRIYALGSILGGSKEEVEQKEKYLQDLVSVAMQKSEPETVAASKGAPGTAANNRAPESAAEAAPELSFHLELRALVVKGTPAQHEIIEQVMKALKENEKPWWPQSK